MTGSIEHGMVTSFPDHGVLNDMEYRNAVASPSDWFWCMLLEQKAILE